MPSAAAHGAPLRDFLGHDEYGRRNFSGVASDVFDPRESCEKGRRVER
jgi:hypothetical protein